MAETNPPENDTNGPVIPRAINLSPTTTSPPADAFETVDSVDFAQRPTLDKPSASDSNVPTNNEETTVQVQGTKQNEAPIPRISRLETDISPSPRPYLLQKSMTERPSPQARRSLFARKRVPTTDRPDSIREHQFSFDPYLSSDSSSSSEDEETPRTTADATRQGHQKRPKAGRGAVSTFRIANENFNTKGHVSRRDGRLKISINEAVNSGYFAKTLGVGLKKYFRTEDEDAEKPAFVDDHHVGEGRIPTDQDEMENPKTRLKLNICIIVIGSRGDIQPFIKIGKILKEDYGHRVRLATHPAFKKFIEEDSGLEFFSVGGNPAELMAFMVKNPGLVPSVETLKAGEIGKRRAAMYDMFQGMWRACINSTDDESDKANLRMSGFNCPSSSGDS